MRRLVALGLLLAVCRGGIAGHGFMNSFADLEWLPAPRRHAAKLVLRARRMGGAMSSLVGRPRR